jgi:hypothetical protein
MSARLIFSGSTQLQNSSEAFSISRSERKPVAAMSDDEQMAALLIAARAWDDAKEGLAPFEPLIEADYMPETLEMGLTIVDAIFRFEDAHERLMRLCDAIKAKDAH